MPSRATFHHERTALSLPERGHARIAVVADTHGAPHPATSKHLLALAPDAILHAGDIGDLSVLDELSAIAPLLAVRGNIDGHAPHTPDARTLAITDGERTLSVVLLMHIAVNGPRLRADAARLARAEQASIVICGHSHVPLLSRERDGVVVFNPGSIGPRRFHLPIVFGVVELERDRITMHHVDVETGARWTPAGARAASSGRAAG